MGMKRSHFGWFGLLGFLGFIEPGLFALFVLLGFWLTPRDGDARANNDG